MYVQKKKTEPPLKIKIGEREPVAFLSSIPTIIQCFLSSTPPAKKEGLYFLCEGIFFVGLPTEKINKSAGCIRAHP